MDEYRQWHRLFGMSLVDLFAGSPVEVEIEKDLSLKQQFLDVVVVRKSAAPLPFRLPDGFDELAPHNLISFKSHREALDAWALDEFVGHYVNYRKQVSPSMADLLPEADFKRFAVCVRFPRALEGRCELEPLQAGVYRAKHFSGEVRVVVVQELPRESQNALLHLFSSRQDAVRYGASQYRPQSRETSTFLWKLLEQYGVEGTPMPFTVEQFNREAMESMRRNPTLVRFILEGEVGAELAAKDPGVVDRVIHDPGVVDKVLGELSIEDLQAELRKRQSPATPADPESESQP